MPPTQRVPEQRVARRARSRRAGDGGALLLAVLIAASCAHAPVVAPPGGTPSHQDAHAEAPPPPPPGKVAPSPPAPPDVEALLAKLSEAQKVGQLMMVGFGGEEVDTGVAALLRGREVGGVCMFKRNIRDAAQIARLNDEVYALFSDSLPPFIAVDQEGGNVVRIADGNLVLPGNMVLGAARDPSLAYQAGKAQGEDLRRLGFNMNLAPVLDVNVNPNNPVIGLRAFGDSVALVSELGSSFVRGQQDANIATVAKHFPGHGSVDADSHKALPVVRATAAQLRAGLKPFEDAMQSGLDGMMTAHIATPGITGDDTPATLSPRVLGQLLRREMKFDGLVLTDELEMNAIDARYGVGRAAVMAVNAGADMVLVPWRIEKKTEVWQALLAAVRSGDISRARLDEAVRRVLTTKVRRGIFTAPAPREERLAALGEKRSLADTIARAGVTLLKADPRVFPVSPARRIAVVTAEASLAEAVARRAPGMRSLVVPAYPPPKFRDELKRQARALAAESDVVIVGVVNTNQLELAANAALAGKPMIVVVMGVPYLASMLPQSSAAIVAVYSYQGSASEAATAALFGERGTPGKLPVAMPRIPYGSGLDPVGKRLATDASGVHGGP